MLKKRHLTTNCAHSCAKTLVQPNNKNLIHFLFVYLKASNFHKVSTLCNEFKAHKFVTPNHGSATLELRFDTHVIMTMSPTKGCYSINSHVVVHPMLHRKI
jgi:hypothetical protein